ncbi:MAG: hypothetical protein J6N18_02480, partial [Kiritimatiellae bacterium]|nr:hypothetical protein [Kiritimatiellia bacterium]
LFFDQNSAAGERSPAANETGGQMRLCRERIPTVMHEEPQKAACILELDINLSPITIEHRNIVISCEKPKLPIFQPRL